MSVGLTQDEAWSVVEASHTGILTTLRRDGGPVSLPVWFVALDRTVCFSTPTGTSKVARIRNDPRAAFLVESGTRWVELRAVHLNGTVEAVGDEETIGRIDAAITAKYAEFRPAAARMPASARKRYGNRSFFRLVPQGPPLSWDNRRLAAVKPS
jgi:PPOX class probable F420-dependent enzyme